MIMDPWVYTRIGCYVSLAYITCLQFLFIGGNEEAVRKMGLWRNKIYVPILAIFIGVVWPFGIIYFAYHLFKPSVKRIEK